MPGLAKVPEIRHNVQNWSRSGFQCARNSAQRSKSVT